MHTALQTSSCTAKELHRQAALIDWATNVALANSAYAPLLLGHAPVPSCLLLQEAHVNPDRPTATSSVLIKTALDQVSMEGSMVCRGAGLEQCSRDLHA